jgi:hypothetical protein
VAGILLSSTLCSRRNARSRASGQVKKAPVLDVRSVYLIAVKQIHQVPWSDALFIRQCDKLVALDLSIRAKIAMVYQPFPNLIIGPCIPESVLCVYVVISRT